MPHSIVAAWMLLLGKEVGCWWKLLLAACCNGSGDSCRWGFLRSSLPNFPVLTDPGESFVPSPASPCASCPRKTLGMFCSYQSYEDMYVCKGDCLLAQAKLGGDPQTVIFNPSLLVSSGEVTQRLGCSELTCLKQWATKYSPSVSEYLTWGPLVSLFSMQHPLVSAQGLDLALPHKIGGIGAQNLKGIQCFPFW